MPSRSTLSRLDPQIMHETRDWIAHLKYQMPGTRKLASSMLTPREKLFVLTSADMAPNREEIERVSPSMPSSILQVADSRGVRRANRFEVYGEFENQNLLGRA